MSSRLLLLLLSSVAVDPVSCMLEAAVILPHGDFALDPTLLPVEDGAARRIANEISDAAHDAGGTWLNRHVDPDLILLSTPHGIALSRDFGLYLGSTASGYVELGRSDLNNKTFGPNRTVRLDDIMLQPELSRQLVDRLSEMNVSGIQFIPDDSQDVPLYWGEVIPLTLIGNRKSSGSRSSFATRQDPKFRRATTTTITTRTTPRRHVILTSPLRRHTQNPVSMVPELLELGRAVYDWIEGRPERIAVVVSADLSHTHRVDGPYGYSPAAASADEALARWASDPCGEPDALLRDAAHLQSQALACGWTGFVMLHGMLCGGGNDDDDADSRREPQWDSEVLAHGNATYYGMMVAQFARRKPREAAAESV